MALHVLRFAPRSLTLRLRAQRECPRRAQRSWVAGGSSLYGLAWLGVLVLVFSFCGPTAAQSNRLSPPQTAFGDAIYGPDRNPGSTAPVNLMGTGICPRLNGIQAPPAGTQDLVDRCNDLAPDQQNPALRQVASEEVASQGRKAVETSTKNIGARLAALRRGASGINIQGLGVNSQEPTLPGTLVAALGPFAAVSSTTTTTTTTTPSPFAGLGLFANGLFAVGDRDPTSNEAGFDFHTYGVIAGVDYRFSPKLVLGAAFTYQSANSDLDNPSSLVGSFSTSANAGSADTRSYGFSLYGTYYVLEQLYIDGIVSFGWNNYSLDRVIGYNVGGTNPVTGQPTKPVNQIAHADPNGHQYSFSVGAGYEFRQGAWTFGPVARLQYFRLDIDGFQETINNPNPGFGWALAQASQDVESLTTVLGGRASYAISTGLGVLLPQVRIEWEHEFKNDSRLLTARFVNDPVGQPILFTTGNPGRNYANLGVSLSATFRPGIAAFIDYETVLGLADFSGNFITLGVRGEF
jgi:uncharacterized protein YhjY with autotransporter beta-barrel domain